MSLRTLVYENLLPTEVAAVAAEALDWSGSEFLLGLDDLSALIATMDSAPDTDGLVRLGHPERPRMELLRGLYDSRSGVQVARVCRLRAPLAWRRVGNRAVSGVVARQQAYWDAHQVFSARGLQSRVVSDRATLAELLEAAEEVGSVLVEAAEPCEGELLMPSEELVDSLCYGLILREPTEDADYFWLGLRADRERPGVLAHALTALARHGVDLDFLHSDNLEEGQHCFYLGFSGTRHSVDVTIATLTNVGFESRILAAFVAEQL